MSDVDAFVRGAGRGPATPRRRWVGPALAGVVLVAVGLLTLRPADAGTAYDPTSTAATGLAGVVDVLRELDVEVELSDDPAVAARADTVLLPPLGWPPEAAADLAAQGPRVVAAVPPGEGAIASALGVGGVGLVDLEPDCDLLADVRSLRTSQWPGWQPEPGTEVAEQCIVRGESAWLTRVPTGSGEVVALATMAPLVNERLVDSDAGLAAVRLLAPTGDERVVVLTAPPGTPPPTLFDLLDPRWFDAAWLTLAVLLALALARGRRLGRPVDEALPVRVPSGELARAIGDLRHRADHDGRAARELRDRTLRQCRRRLGLPPSADADAVLAALRAQDIATSPQVAAALTGPLPVDGDGLVATARALAELRAALHDPARSTARPTDQPTPPDATPPRSTP